MRNIINLYGVNTVEPRSISCHIIKIREQLAPEGEPGPVEVTHADMVVVFCAVQLVGFAEISLRICKLQRINNQPISRSQEFV
jgi:hypothetical protein